MAARALATAFVNIVPGTADLESYLKTQLPGQANAAGVHTGDAMAKGMASGMGAKIKNYLKPVLATVGTTFAAVGIANFVKDAIGAGSAFEAEFEGVNQAFGTSAGLVQEYAKNASKFIGLSEVDALKASKFFGTYGKAAKLAGDENAKFSTGLLQVAGDLGSFFDTSTEDAIAAISSGLSGESEPLKKYGILLNKDSLEAAALAEGIAKVNVDSVKLDAAMINAEKAQTKYNEAVKKYGPESLQARDALNDLEAAQHKVGVASKGKVDALTAEQKILAAQAVIYNSLGPAQGDFVKYSDTFANALKTTTADAANLAKEFGLVLLPVLTTLVTFVRDVVLPGLTGLFNFFKDYAAPIAAFAATLGIFAIALNATAIATGIMTAATNLMTIATKLQTAAMLASPWVWVALAVAALVAGIVYLATETTFFQDTWEAMTQIVTAAWEATTQFFSDTFTNIGQWFSDLWTGATKAWDTFYNGIKTAVETVAKFFKDAFEGVGKFIGEVFNNLVALIKAPLNLIIGMINKVVGALNTIRIDIPSWVPGLGGRSFGVNIPPIPALAEGGFVDRPTFALIGEAGPEVVTPLADFERMIGTGGGKTLVYNAAPNQSIDAEQALFTAMRRAKVVAQW